MKLYDNKQLKLLMHGVVGQVVDKLRERLVLQGHVDSKKLWRSISFTIDLENEAIVGNIRFLAYGKDIDTGIPASEFKQMGKGKKMAKIQELFGFFRRKGFPPRDALSFSYRTFGAWTREGMPTRASKRFSKDVGQTRVGFVGRTIEDVTPMLIDNLTIDATKKAFLTITSEFKPYGIDQVLAL